MSLIKDYAHNIKMVEKYLKKPVFLEFSSNSAPDICFQIYENFQDRKGKGWEKNNEYSLGMDKLR